MRNAVIRKRAIALRALMNAPARLMLGANMTEVNIAAIEKESRLWAVPTPSYGAFK